MHPGLPKARDRDRHIDLLARLTPDDPPELSDQDLLELVLRPSLRDPSKSKLAKDLLKHHGSIGAVVNADDLDISDDDRRRLTLARLMTQRLTSRRLEVRPVITSWDALRSYCRARIAHLPKEEFHVLYLNRKNALIADETLGRGTVDHVPVYPREVLRRALDLNACALILVHNHPSGDPTPSDADIEITKQIKLATHAMSITLHDHLIIGADREVSMVSEGMI